MRQATLLTWSLDRIRKVHQLVLINLCKYLYRLRSVKPPWRLKMTVISHEPWLGEATPRFPLLYKSLLRLQGDHKRLTNQKHLISFKMTSTERALLHRSANLSFCPDLQLQCLQSFKFQIPRSTSTTSNRDAVHECLTSFAIV